MTAKQEQAALLVALDELTNDEISKQCAISTRTLYDWRQKDEFAGRVDAIIAEMSKTLLRHGIARLDRRMARLDRDWRKLQTVIEQRAANARDQQADNERVLDASRQLGASPEQVARLRADLPTVAAGMDTGLVIRQVKPTRDGGFFEEFAVDTGLLGELRAMEMQAAKELGQLVERADVTSMGDRVSGVVVLPDNGRDRDAE